MTFEQLCDRLVALYDCTQARAVDVANERLQRLVTESKSLRAIKSLGTTVANTTSYALDATVVQVYKVKVVYPVGGTVIYEGASTIETLWDIDLGDTQTDGNFFAIEADSDSLLTTDNLRLYPTPTEAGTITGLVAIQPATLTYATATALPIHLDTHEHLLAGCKAELSDEESRQDEAQKFEAVFLAGITKLRGRVEARGKGSGHHRMGVRGYDFAPHGATLRR